MPAPDPATGELSAGWPATDTFTFPPGSKSGYYEATFAITSGPSTGMTASTFVILREPRSQRSQILVQVPVNTWQAYNAWGGKSLYNFNSTEGVPATHVSFDRPYRWADAPLRWEIQAVRFLEREGYDVSYQTDVDTDRRPTSLRGRKIVITVGHGEYWSRRMRGAFEAARDTGTNLVFLGANTAYWQARYADDRHTLVEYRSDADPISDPLQKTMLFRDLGWAECELLGVQFQGKMGADDYSVNPDALGDRWFAGTGFGPTSVLRGLVGPERDSVPATLPGGCYKPGLTTFFRYRPSNAPLGEVGNADAVRYVAPSGAIVFSSGSLMFSWGLDAFRLDGPGGGVASTQLQRFMKNVLDDMIRTRLRPASTAGATPSG